VTPRVITTLLLVIAAVAATGCGADEETKPSIPADSAQALQARLDEVQRRFEAGGGACGDIINDTEPAVESILASLPSSVEADVRGAVADSFDRLFELSTEQCDDEEQSTTPTETETTDTTETETTDTTETETTDTTTTETTPTETTPTTETVPPPDDGDDGDDGGTGGGGAGPGL
jgi:hypothetical protein